MNEKPYLIIDGEKFYMNIKSLERSLDALYKYAERTESGELHSEIIGWYHNYHIEVGLEEDSVTYERLLNKLTEPKEFHVVSIPTTRGMTPSYEAYFAGIVDKILRLRGTNNVWYSLAFDIIARKPHRRK